MDCPKCDREMDYEEIKWPCGTYHCECGYECDGEYTHGGDNEKLYKDTERMEKR